MTSSSTFKKQVRAYAAEHGLKYADALRRLTEDGHGPVSGTAVASLRQRSYTAKVTEPSQRPVWMIQPGEYDNGVLPYQLGMLPGGTVIQQDLYRGSTCGVHGIIPTAVERTHVSMWHEWIFGAEEEVRQRLLGQYLVVRTGNSDLWVGGSEEEYGRSYNLGSYEGAIIAVEKRVLGPLPPITAYFEPTEAYASDWSSFVTEEFAGHPEVADLRRGFTFDVADWIGLLTDEHMREARADGWRHPAINHFLYFARSRFEIPYGTKPTPEQIAEWGFDPGHPAVAGAGWAEDRTEFVWDDDLEAERQIEPFTIRLDADQVEWHLSSYSTGGYPEQLRRTLRATIQVSGAGDGSAGDDGDDVEEVMTILTDTHAIGRLGIADLLSLRWGQWLTPTCRLDADRLALIEPLTRSGVRDGALGDLRDIDTPDASALRLLAVVAGSAADLGEADRARLIGRLQEVTANPRAEIIVSIDPDDIEEFVTGWTNGHGQAASRNAQDLNRTLIRAVKPDGLDHFAAGVFWALYSPGWLHHPDRRGGFGALTDQARDYLCDSGIGVTIPGWDTAADESAQGRVFGAAWETLQQRRENLLGRMSDLLDRAEGVGR